MNMRQLMYPKKQGLYDPAFEHDACGVGLLAHINGSKSHDIVEKGLQVLENMVHRADYAFGIFLVIVHVSSPSRPFNMT